jgi:hypothetical protein
MRDRLHLSTAILAQWQHPVASTEALDLLRCAMCVVLHRHTAATIKMASKVGPWPFFLPPFCLMLHWQPLGQYGATSPPMAASSGFWSSPGHVPLGNAICIAPAYCRGHQNGQQRRCMCLLLLHFCMTLLITKDHVMVH